MAVQTISAQVRELEKPFLSLLRSEGRNLVLTDAGVAAMHEADQIFALGEQLPHRVREAAALHPAAEPGHSDGIAKLAVHRLLTTVLDEPHLRLLCHEGEFQPPCWVSWPCTSSTPCWQTARHRPTRPQTTSQLLSTSAVAWYAPLVGRRGAAGLPKSLAVVPVLLPTDHAAMRARIDHWFERERIRPALQVSSKTAPC